MLTLLLAAPLAQAPAAAPPGPIDFAAVPRHLDKSPAFVGEPRYGLFLFGPKGETRVWAVLDRSSASAKGRDVLYLDLDGDGDLTEANERFTGDRPEVSVGEGAQYTFTIGDFRPPGSDWTHTDFRITASDDHVHFSLKWRGGKETHGGYAPQRADYVGFAATLAEAPIYVPGFDLPFQFEHWMSGELQRSGPVDFKVFLGNRGSRKGTFTCGDDKFLEKDEYVVATLLYEDGEGKRMEKRFDLRNRC